MNNLRTAVIFLLFGCASSPERIAGGPPRLTSDVARATWHAIERAEFTRRPNDALLRAARSPDDVLRARATVALGRLRWPEVPEAAVTEALIVNLGDPQAEVRARAAFGLGLRADPSAAEALRTVAFGLDDDGERSEPDPTVRARAIEAASKLDASPEHGLALLAGLDDDDPTVQREAAIAGHRCADSIDVDRRLLEALRSARGTELAAHLLFSLQRRRSQLAVPAFLAYARSEDELERLWAVRGLARAAPTDEIEIGLRRAVADPDERIAFEALQALGDYPSEGTSDVVRRAVTHPSAHVRAQALRSIRRAEDAAEARRGDAVQVAGHRLTSDRDRWHSWARNPSTEVRRAAARALPAEVFAGGAAWPFASDPSPYVRAAWAERLGEADELDFDALEELLADSHPVVVAAAIGTLATSGVAGGRDRVRTFVRHDDNGLRLAALDALAAEPEPEDLPSFEHAFFTSTGDGAVEVRFHALRAAASIGDPARSLLERGLTDEAPFVRRTAREELEKLGTDPPATAGAAVDPEATPLYGIDWTFDRNPWVEIVTQRGALRFELFPFEAPWHVHNFLTLVAEGHYDGLGFHRVVPDFVVQGGDYRGDGSGARTTNGVPLRHEIGPRKFVRGSLGMPRHDDWDSGGSQLFVTHRPTPHLDGRYTIFGELREGFDVLDRTQIGDRILRVREVEPPREE